MRIVLAVVVGLVLLVGVAAAIGMALPREHRATSEVVLARAPDEVWPAVRDLSALQGTWAELESARRVDDPAGREVWEETVDGFAMRFVVVEDEPPARMVTEIDAAEDAAFGGRWIYELTAVEGGTRVRVTEDGWVANPLFRVMLALGGMHGTLDRYLKALGRHFGETVTPAHVDADAA